MPRLLDGPVREFDTDSLWMAALVKLAILYDVFYDEEGKQFLIGGVQTYIQRLVALGASLGLDPVVFQPARVSFQRKEGKGLVVGLPIPKVSSKDKMRFLYAEVLRRVQDRDLIVFASDHISVKTARKRVISIQHGILWDLPTSPLRRWTRLVPELRAWREHIPRVIKGLRNFSNCANVVCVDYNFLNWYRATRGGQHGWNAWVIPNFCCPAPEGRIRRANATVTRVLFARRFELYRGTRLMADSITQVLSNRNDFQFTFAGDGPDLAYLAQRFQDRSQIQFIRYLPDQSVEIHLEHDIAVTPSLGSEGTTLSLAEAMGAGCAVIATPVGGITNMILDGFNGLLVRPRPEELASAFLRLADDPTLRRKLGENAHRTAKECFDLELWNERWTRVLEHVCSLET